MTTTDAAPPTSRFLLDRSIATLKGRAAVWAERPIGERIADIKLLRARTFEVAPDIVAAACAAKGISGQAMGEEWVGGPLTALRTMRFLQGTLEGIRRSGEVPVPDTAIRERPDSQVEVDVLPGDLWDRLMYRGWSAAVRLDPEIRRGSARVHMGGRYTKSERPEPGLSVVLGAGNQTSISLLDVVHKLFVDDRVVLLKFNPVNEYAGRYVEYAFAHLIEAGFVRTCYGGADVGAYLVRHPDVDDIHITGSEQTHDTIVFGSGAEGAANKQANRPILTKPIASELGNVSPVIIAPGSWSRRQLDYQAEHLATQLLQNAGYNCNAAKVVILPEGWEQAGEFMDRVGALLASRPDRPAFYPGSKERYDRVLASGGKIQTFGRSADGLPPTVIDVAADADHAAFSEEAFCRVMATVRIPGASPGEFLDRAVSFSNERLRGTLNATIIADRAVLKSSAGAIERSIDTLRYGTVGLNLWAAAGFPLGVTPWGAFPGHTLDDIGSGIGFVHNARLIDRPQKTVIRAPFTMWPKPAWSVFHRNAAVAMARTTSFEASPSLAKIPRIVWAAARA